MIAVLMGHVAWTCECGSYLPVVRDGVVACQYAQCARFGEEYEEPKITVDLKPVATVLQVPGVGVTISCGLANDSAHYTQDVVGASAAEAKRGAIQLSSMFALELARVIRAAAAVL